MSELVFVGIGELLWDMLPSGRQMGGAPANFCYHSTCQGAKGIPVSAVGKDPSGAGLIADLANKGLPTRYIQRRDQPTGTVDVQLSDGVPTYTIHEKVAWDYIEWNESLEKLLQTANAVCFGSLAQRSPVSASTIKRTLETAGSGGALKVFDVNIRQHFCNESILHASLNLSNLLKVSDEELPELMRMLGLTGDSRTELQGLLERFDLQAILLTRGEAGCEYFSHGESYSVPAAQWGPVVDTVGCGDAFTAAFMVALLSGRSAEASLHHANNLAGFVSTVKGATPIVPDEIRML
jgi:fructokinase